MKLFGILLAVLICSSVSCKRTATSFQRKFESGERTYVIEQYSGGVKIKEYRFRGILNNAKRSDGFYWFVGDTLYEVSGDVAIRSWK